MFNKAARAAATLGKVVTDKGAFDAAAALVGAATALVGAAFVGTELVGATVVLGSVRLLPVVPTLVPAWAAAAV